MIDIPTIVFIKNRLPWHNYDQWLHDNIPEGESTYFFPLREFSFLHKEDALAFALRFDGEIKVIHEESNN